MTSSIKLAALTVALTVASAATANAQVHAYRHRSTVFGDHAAGYSEFVRAQGAFLKDEALAAETWVRVYTAMDARAYQLAEYRFQEQLRYENYVKEKANAKRERQASESAALETAAIQLHNQAQRGGVIWPKALTRPEFASSVSLIDSILRNWAPDSSAGEAYRRALATEAAVLRARVTNHRKIDFLSQVEAVETLAKIQMLAAMPAPGEANSSLAMR